MHVAVTISIIFAVWRWGNWEHWQRYHTTMLYISIGNLMYDFLCADHFLWTFKPDFLSGFALTELLYTLIVFPAIALLFLSNYPSEKIRQITYILKWILVFVFMEWIYHGLGLIEYQNGWNLGWSAFFDSIMFPMLYLHHRKPILAYLISVPVAALLIWYFDIPVELIVKRSN